MESFIIDQDLEYTPRLLLSSESVAPETQERFEALLEAAGMWFYVVCSDICHILEALEPLTLF